jgi:hypothetical protein
MNNKELNEEEKILGDPNNENYIIMNKIKIKKNVSIFIIISELFWQTYLFYQNFGNLGKPSEILGNLRTSPKISENLGRFLTTSTGFGPIPNIIFDTDVFLSWLFVECSRRVKVLVPAFRR